ncbi:hypothetical protein EC973_009604 [Apophysomyces ossiformis]|uniref:NET domain-containing protein n=1 Tax=Apophysomyces ossiformis TaxID=679940 RepID=A0A8H7EPF3_9FUNG|nr:hypothetical protein EC973_009604 [Apophysomyces ossiformis]
MTGLTIAHQLVSNDTDDSFPKLKPHAANDPVVTDEQLNELLASTSRAWPEATVEDLTGEVQDLMMRQWLQPYSDSNPTCLEGFDPQLYAQSIQDLFGQDEFNFDNDATASPFYDELTFPADDASLTVSPSTSSSSSSSSPAQSPLVHPTVLDALEDITYQELDELVPEEQANASITETDTTSLDAISLKRRRSSSSSESESCDDDDSSDDSDSDDDGDLIPTTVATLTGRRRASYSSSDDSDLELDSPMTRVVSSPENSYKYMQKRQIEETLLDKITNHLNAEKLPGILSILSSENAGHQNDEVEIDLSRLAREQLVRVLAYVEACILEQEGGPVVNVADYILKAQTTKRKGPRTRPALEQFSEDEEDYNEPVRRQRKPRKPRQKKRCEKEVEGNVFETLDPSGLSTGPISMSALSKRQSEAKKKRSRGGRKPANKRKGQNAQADDEVIVSSAVAMIHDQDSIAVSRPKRRAALHKRRLLEEMLQPSDNEEDEDDDVLVVFSDEQMDMAVTTNQTIVHQPDAPVSVIAPVVPLSPCEEEEDNDEEIDIML